MERKHKIFGFSVPTVLAAILLVAMFAFGNPMVLIRVYAAGTPDAYGDQIENLTISQWNGASYDVLAVYTSANYSASFEVEVQEDYKIRTRCWVRLNSSFAASGSEANSNTEVNVTISGGGATGKSNYTLSVNTSGVQVGNFWYVEYGMVGDEWEEAGHPAAGTTYDLKIYYHAYY